MGTGAAGRKKQNRINLSNTYVLSSTSFSYVLLRLIRFCFFLPAAPVPKNEAFGFLADFIPHGMIKRVPFKIQLEEGITELEKEILFNYPTHSDLGDCMNYMLRSRWTRMIYKGKEIPCRPCTKTHYTRGDVVIVNDNLAHYRGEIQIVLKDMKVDGQRNLLGRIDESEIFILEHIKAKDVFTFVE